MDVLLRMDLNEAVLMFQQGEMNEYEVYTRLSKRTRGKNCEVLNAIAQDELFHYNNLKKYSKEELHPQRSFVLKHEILYYVFGLTFCVKLMESKENKAQKAYSGISSQIAEVAGHIDDEDRHEQALIDMIDEKRLGYLGTILSGLNDAWIGLIGEVAGFSFAFQDPRIIGFAGLIAAIAQFLSSSASEIESYLSQKSEETESALRGSLFQGIVYLLTVGLLIFPFFLLSSYTVALGITVSTALVIITLFTYYNSVIRSLSFKTMFPTMLGITLGVGAAAFAIGFIAKSILNL